MSADPHNRALYDFRCPSCDWRWEAFARSDRPKLDTCPNCGAQGERAFSTFASPASFGHSIWPQRTPTHLLKPRRDDEDRDIWQAKKDAGVTLHPAPGKG